LQEEEDMTIHQISVSVENRRGKMAEIVELLASKEIDIRALTLAEASEFGLLRLIVSDPDIAAALLREAGMMVRSCEVVAVGVSDRPGEFSKAARLIADAGVNLEYLYALAYCGNNEAVIIMRLDQPGEGIFALRKGGFRIIEPEEIFRN
jgi:hypothetical protein